MQGGTIRHHLCIPPNSTATFSHEGYTIISAESNIGKNNMYISDQAQISGDIKLTSGNYIFLLVR